MFSYESALIARTRTFSVRGRSEIARLFSEFQITMISRLPVFIYFWLISFCLTSPLQLMFRGFTLMSALSRHGGFQRHTPWLCMHTQKKSVTFLCHPPQFTAESQSELSQAAASRPFLFLPSPACSSSSHVP